MKLARDMNFEARDTLAMIPKELFKKVRRIQITTSRLVTDVFAGQYHSVFKGRGMEFDEVREYQIGDDIRTIDWNVTARTGRAHVKKFVEEREMTVMLLIDTSTSCHFGSSRELKSKLAAEIAAVLAFSAIRNHDKVGVIFFTDKIEKFIPPRKGVKNVLRLIREILYFRPQNRGTSIAQAVEYLNRITTRKTVSFIVSDFYEPGLDFLDPKTDQNRLKKMLAIADKRHDLIAITLNDPREMELENAGLIMLEDSETGALSLVDSSDEKIRTQYRRLAETRTANRARFFQSIGVDHIDVSTATPFVDELVKFFLRRRHLRR